MRCVGSESFYLNNSLWDWESGLQRGGCCIVMEGSAVLCWVGKRLFKQLLMGLGDWTSEARVLYSNGMECCVALGRKTVIQTTPDGIGRVDFGGKGAA